MRPLLETEMSREERTRPMEVAPDPVSASIPPDPWSAPGQRSVSVSVIFRGSLPRARC